MGINYFVWVLFDCDCLVLWGVFPFLNFNSFLLLHFDGLGYI